MQVVDAGEQGVAHLAACLQSQLVVACPAESSTNDAAAVLLRLSVERYHDLGAVVHSRAHTIVVHDDLQTGRQRLLCHASLLSPRTMEVCQPRTATLGGVALAQSLLPEGHHAAGILLQFDGFLLAVANHGPSLYDVALVVGPVAEVHVEVVLLVLQCNDGHVAVLSASRHHELR